MIKTIQELQRGDVIEHTFFCPSRKCEIRAHCEVTDKELNERKPEFLLALEFDGHLFEQSFPVNTAFIVKDF